MATLLQVTERRRGPGRRTVLLAIILLAFTLRPAVTATSSLLPRVLDGVPLTVTQAGLLGSFPPFCFAAAGLLVPWLTRRLSAERIAVLLLVVGGALQVVRPWAPGAWAFLTTSVVVLVALGSGNVVLPPIVKAWYPHRIPSVTAVYLVAVTAGAALPPLVSVTVADAVGSGPDGAGWQVSLALWGVVCGVAVVAWLAPAAHPRTVPRRRPVLADRTDGDRTDADRADAERTDGEGPADGAPPAPHPAHLPVWRSRVAWGVAVVFGFQSFAAYIVFTWLPTRLTDAGLGDQEAGVMLSIFAAMGLPAAMAVPWLTARVRSTLGLVVSFAACFAAGLVALAVAPTAATLLWVLVAGWGSGIFPLSLTLVNLRTRTPSSAGALSGFAQGTGYLVAGTGPLLAGAVHASTGSWTVPFLLAAGSMVVVVAGAVLTGEGRTVEDDLERAGRRARTVTLDG